MELVTVPYSSGEIFLHSVQENNSLDPGIRIKPFTMQYVDWEIQKIIQLV